MRERFSAICETNYCIKTAYISCSKKMQVYSIINKNSKLYYLLLVAALRFARKMIFIYENSEIFLWSTLEAREDATYIGRAKYKIFQWQTNNVWPWDLFVVLYYALISLYSLCNFCFLTGIVGTLAPFAHLVASLHPTGSTEGHDYCIVMLLIRIAASTAYFVLQHQIIKLHVWKF